MLDTVRIYSYKGPPGKVQVMSEEFPVPPAFPRLKGRGTSNNADSRYLQLRSEPVDDGWNHSGQPEGAEEDEFSLQLKTQAFADRTKTLITRNRSPDISFSQSINPYKGCEHGCIYCFARPTHAYLDLSPGLDFETKLFYKTNVRAHLLKELGKPSYRCSTLAMGTNTDPYQPLEKTQRNTRQILETLLELRHPVSIVTKSSLILRDLDLLGALAAQNLASVYVSVTTLDVDLKTRLEPRTAGPGARLRVIKELRRAGVPVGAMVAPVIPFLNDHELENIVSACAAAGANDASYILLRLPLEVRPLFEEWLGVHYPLKAGRVMAAVKETRGGRAYDAAWHKRMVGEGEIAQLIEARFKLALKKAGMSSDNVSRGKGMPALRTDLFVPPSGSNHNQLSLF